MQGKRMRSLIRCRLLSFCLDGSWSAREVVKTRIKKRDYLSLTSRKKKQRNGDKYIVAGRLLLSLSSLNRNFPFFFLYLTNWSCSISSFADRFSSPSILAVLPTACRCIPCVRLPEQTGDKEAERRQSVTIILNINAPKMFALNINVISTLTSFKGTRDYKRTKYKRWPPSRQRRWAEATRRLPKRGEMNKKRKEKNKPERIGCFVRGINQKKKKESVRIGTRRKSCCVFGQVNNGQEGRKKGERSRERVFFLSPLAALSPRQHPAPKR